MKTTALKFRAAKIAGLALSGEFEGHPQWTGTPKQWDTFEWVLNYWDMYRAIPNV